MESSVTNEFKHKTSMLESIGSQRIQVIDMVNRKRFWNFTEAEICEAAVYVNWIPIKSNCEWGFRFRSEIHWNKTNASDGI